MQARSALSGAVIAEVVHIDAVDHVFDSAAFLDNMTLGTQSVTGCQKGAQPLSNVSLTVNGASSATVPAGFSDMPTSGLNYATPAVGATPTIAIATRG